MVIVTTKLREGSPSEPVPNSREDLGVQISISDNGPGIPDAIKDKIFQPFFTTKPTGQGTGLGLSLAYDIVKAHGGEMTVESHENEGTNFTIKLPIS
jgi:signal transduction histidine kinase